MIVVKLWGGLGNQLFQYAYGYSVAKRLNTKLYFDISFYHRQTLRKPVILSLNIDENRVISDEKIPKIIKWLNKKNPNRLIRIPSYSKFPVSHGYTYLKESRRRFDHRICEYGTDNSYLDGYWQCQDYFIDNEDDLIRQFTVDSVNGTKMQEVINELQGCNSVSLHIRRGDYAEKRKFYSNLILLGNQYFRDALMEAETEIDNPVIYIFTDDIEWVKANFNFHAKYKMISDLIDGSDVEELILMSKCKNHIVSNSTYSWWAAWLNRNEDKKVWAPDKGWGNKNVLPKEWKKVKVTEYI